MALEDIVRKHYAPKTVLGEAEKAALVADLRTFRRRQTALAILLCLCVLALFVVGLWGGIVHLRDPARLGLLTGGLGVTATGAVALLSRKMREWGRVDLTLLLILHADEERAQELLLELRTLLAG